MVAGDARVWHAVSSAGGGENNDSVDHDGVRNVLEIYDGHAPVRGIRKLVRTAEAVIAYTVFVRAGQGQTQGPQSGRRRIPRSAGADCSAPAGRT